MNTYIFLAENDFLFIYIYMVSCCFGTQGDQGEKGARVSMCNKRSRSEDSTTRIGHERRRHTSRRDHGKERIVPRATTNMEEGQ